MGNSTENLNLGKPFLPPNNLTWSNSTIYEKSDTAITAFYWR